MAHAQSPGGGLRGWPRFQAASALAAAGISIALGVFWTPPRTTDDQRSWVRALRGLERVPVTAGTRLVLAPPPGTPRSEQTFWLYEARWRRPDLLWSAVKDWPLAEPPTVAVAVGLKDMPAGWREVWRHGDLRLARRDQAP